MSFPRKPYVLVVEDSDEDYSVLAGAFLNTEARYEIVRRTDGEEAIDFLVATEAAHGVLPATILLDLNLPDIDGREVLVRLKKTARFRHVPVIVLSTSANPKDVETSYRNGANGYAVKPVDLDKFERFIALFSEFWLGHMVLPQFVAVEASA